MTNVVADVGAPRHTLYLSGPMTGYPAFNEVAFDAAEVAARRWVSESAVPGKWVIVNPAQRAREFFGVTSLGAVPLTRAVVARHVLLREDLRALTARPDALLVLLPGWQRSEGARLELAVAAALGFKAAPLLGAVEAGFSVGVPVRAPALLSGVSA